MDLTPLPFRRHTSAVPRAGRSTVEAWRAGDASAIQIVRHKHPRFLNPAIPWLPKKLSDAEVRSEAFDLSDAELTVARAYDFENWARLAEHVAAVTDEDSAVWRFESAVEAVVHGDIATLESLLRATSRTWCTRAPRA